MGVCAGCSHELGYVPMNVWFVVLLVSSMGGSPLDFLSILFMSKLFDTFDVSWIVEVYRLQGLWYDSVSF